MLPLLILNIFINLRQYNPKLNSYNDCTIRKINILHTNNRVVFFINDIPSLCTHDQKVFFWLYNKAFWLLLLAVSFFEINVIDELVSKFYLRIDRSWNQNKYKMSEVNISRKKSLNLLLLQWKSCCWMNLRSLVFFFIVCRCQVLVSMAWARWWFTQTYFLLYFSLFKPVNVQRFLGMNFVEEHDLDNQTLSLFMLLVIWFWVGKQTSWTKEQMYCPGPLGQEWRPWFITIKTRVQIPICMVSEVYLTDEGQIAWINTLFHRSRT